MSDLCSGQLKLYSNIPETEVDWLWYPYIPFGKLTVLNGDPGNGKSTLMMNIIAAASSGGFVPDGRKMKKPIHVIYQCSEDSAGDTIKPRLIAAGADCSNVGFIDEELTTLSLNDEVIRRAIADFNAKLLVIDPVQAYLGEADISNVGGMRRVLHQLSLWAARYDCAVVLVGHLNKRQSSKDISLQTFTHGIWMRRTECPERLSRERISPCSIWMRPRSSSTMKCSCIRNENHKND